MKVLLAVGGHEGDPPGNVLKAWTYFKWVEVPWTYISVGDTVSLDPESDVTETVKNIYFSMDHIQLEFTVYNINNEHIWGEGAEKYLIENGYTQDGYKRESD